MLWVLCHSYSHPLSLTPSTAEQDLSEIVKELMAKEQDLALKAGASMQ